MCQFQPAAEGFSLHALCLYRTHTCVCVSFQPVVKAFLSMPFAITLHTLVYHFQPAAKIVFLHLLFLFLANRLVSHHQPAAKTNPLLAADAHNAFTCASQATMTLSAYMHNCDLLPHIRLHVRQSSHGSVAAACLWLLTTSCLAAHLHVPAGVPLHA